MVPCHDGYVYPGRPAPHLLCRRYLHHQKIRSEPDCWCCHGNCRAHQPPLPSGRIPHEPRRRLHPFACTFHTYLRLLRQGKPAEVTGERCEAGCHQQGYRLRSREVFLYSGKRTSQGCHFYCPGWQDVRDRRSFGFR